MKKKKQKNTQNKFKTSEELYGIKMSDALMFLIQPVLEDKKRFKLESDELTILTLADMAKMVWNSCAVEDETKALLMRSLIILANQKTLYKRSGNPRVKQIVDMMFEIKQNMFADINTIIDEVKFIKVGENISLQVSSQSLTNSQNITPVSNPKTASCNKSFTFIEIDKAFREAFEGSDILHDKWLYELDRCQPFIMQKVALCHELLRDKTYHNILLLHILILHRLFGEKIEVITDDDLVKAHRTEITILATKEDKCPEGLLRQMFIDNLASNGFELFKCDGDKKTILTAILTYSMAYSLKKHGK